MKWVGRNQKGNRKRGMKGGEVGWLCGCFTTRKRMTLERINKLTAILAVLWGNWEKAHFLRRGRRWWPKKDRNVPGKNWTSWVLTWEPIRQWTCGLIYGIRAAYSDITFCWCPGKTGSPGMVMKGGRRQWFHFLVLWVDRSQLKRAEVAGGCVMAHRVGIEGESKNKKS